MLIVCYGFVTRVLVVICMFRKFFSNFFDSDGWMISSFLKVKICFQFQFFCFVSVIRDVSASTVVSFRRLESLVELLRGTKREDLKRSCESVSEYW
jgi:hypothetical protein